jgi:putative serine protease PepD
LNATPNPYARPAWPYLPIADTKPIASPAARSRHGLVVAAVAAALVAAGVGGVTGVAADRLWSALPTDQPIATAVQASAESSIADVAKKVLPSVVQLRVRTTDGQETGSGVILDSDGLILTNNHVVAAAVEGANSAFHSVATEVSLSDGQTASFTVLGSDPVKDVAVVRAEGLSGLTPIAIGSSADLRVGQTVVAVGSPLGLQGTVTSGIVSALNRPVSTREDGQRTQYQAIQTDAAINPGNSGGALVNLRGELIGINSASASVGSARKSGSIGLGFAIPIDQAKRVADQLIADAAHS